MFWCLEFYSATLLSKVLLFSIMFRSLDRQPKFSVCLITTLVGFLIYDFCSYNSYGILIGSLMGWSLARRNSRAVSGRVHFPTLPIIYSNYNQCMCAVQIKHGDNKSGRGALEGDKMHPRGDEEGVLECKSANAKRLLRE